MSSAWSIRSTATAVIVGGLALAAGGCQHLVNPYADELAAGSSVTTSSVDAARATSVERRVAHRPYAPIEAPVHVGVVTHGPLYFSDPVESVACDDGRYAWTIRDHAYGLYGPSRFLMNIVCFPIKAAVRPPWQVTTSDGS